MNIRKLKEKNVAVFFEKEGINTLEGSGELLVTILSSQAQEESRNISENTRWGIVRKFEKGKLIVNHNKFMGYTKNADGTITLIVDGVWPDYNSDLAFRNTVVVQPFEDGTFRYLSNSIEQIELELPPIAKAH